MAWRRASDITAHLCVGLWGVHVAACVYLLGLGMTSLYMVISLSGFVIGITYTYSPRPPLMRRLIILVLAPMVLVGTVADEPGVTILMVAFGAYLLVLGRHLGVEYWRSAVGFTQLGIGRDALRLVLDNVEQGLLTLDRAGRISAERSAAVDTWFGAISSDTRFGDFLRRVDPTVADHFDVTWDILIDSLQDPQLLGIMVRQLPRRLCAGPRTFDIAYRPISEQGGGKPVFQRMLVVISDITSAVVREHVEHAQREQLQIFERITRDRAGANEFRAEVNRLVEYVCAESSPPLPALRRAVHTLKGNAAMFGLHSIAKICQELEAEMAERLDPPAPAHLAPLHTRWTEVEATLASFLDTDARDRIDLRRNDLQELVAAIERDTPRHALIAMIEAWALEPMAQRLPRIAEQVRHLARTLQKGEVCIIEEPNGVRLDAARWAPFWSALVHIARNAVDHGLETPDERIAAGKLEPATIALRTRQLDGELVIEIEDNGRGVDWPRIAAKACSLGLAAATRDDLVEALLTDGVTTRTEVTETSGRGVGTSAARHECEARGGRVEVISEPGIGTTFRFRFPVRPGFAGYRPPVSGAATRVTPMLAAGAPRPALNRG